MKRYKISYLTVGDGELIDALALYGDISHHDSHFLDDGIFYVVNLILETEVDMTQFDLESHDVGYVSVVEVDERHEIVRTRTEVHGYIA